MFGASPWKNVVVNPFFRSYRVLGDLKDNPEVKSLFTEKPVEIEWMVNVHGKVFWTGERLLQQILN